MAYTVNERGPFYQAGQGPRPLPGTTSGYSAAQNNPAARLAALNATGMPAGPAAPRPGQGTNVDGRWLNWMQNQRITPTQFKAFNPQASGVANYSFMGGGPTRAVTAAQGDWGLSDAAKAQVNLIRDWTNDNVAAAGEGEIARGMGRSGSYDAVRLDATQEGALQAANQMAQAAAEAGRLNQQIAMQNAQLGTDVNIANQNALLQADQIRSGYNQFLKGLALDAFRANTDARLGFLNFDEGRRQFNDRIAFDRTVNNRQYQMDRLGFNENQRQFDAGNAVDRYQAQTGRYGQMDSANQWMSQLGENARQFNVDQGNSMQRYLMEAAAQQQAAAQQAAGGGGYGINPNQAIAIAKANGGVDPDTGQLTTYGRMLLRNMGFDPSGVNPGLANSLGL